MAAASLLIHKIGGVALEVAQRMDVSANVEHGASCTKSAFNLMQSIRQNVVESSVHADAGGKSTFVIAFGLRGGGMANYGKLRDRSLACWTNR